MLFFEIRKYFLAIRPYFLFFPCSIENNSLPLQSQIRAIGFADILLKAFISACFGTLKLGNFR